MRKYLERIGKLVVAPVLLAGTALAVGASPAYASTTKCSAYQYQTGPVVTNVAMKTCVVKNGNARYAYILVEEARAYGGKDWDKFKVHARLEHNDANIATKWCDLTDDMNNYKNPRLFCKTKTVTSSTQGGWTGDGVLIYNINLDGLGDKSRALNGSPSVS